MRALLFSLFTLCFIPHLGCTKSEDFDAIGTRVAGPIDIAVTDDGQYFYALNSDFDREYNTGSILVISENGEQVGSITVPRLGRAIKVAGNDMIIVYDKADDDSKFLVQLFDISTPTSPQFKTQWTEDTAGIEEFNCTPVNIAMVAGYQHFAIACRTGRLFVGTLATPREASTLKLVRNHGYTRRAMFLDPTREILIQFPTDMSLQRTQDLIADDVKSYDIITGNSEDVPNEIPDEFEDTKFRRRSTTSTRRKFYYSIYNIGAERTKEFPYLDIDVEEHEEEVQKELRWIYFTLRDFDGTPDTESGITNLESRHYRTNFWAARPDPVDPNAFYLSHRGKLSKKNQFANSIIKVTIVGDITQTDPVIFTEDALSFERVYGFSGELDGDNHFPGDFELEFVNGRLTLAVNHFKDQVNFRGDSSYAVAAKVLDGGQWHQEINSRSSSNSYYQLAMNERGKVLVCAFYGNALIPLVVDPGANITVGWDNIVRIE